MVTVLLSFLAITNPVRTVGDHWPAVVLSTGVYTFNLYLIIMLAKNGFFSQSLVIGFFEPNGDPAFERSLTVLNH